MGDVTVNGCRSLSLQRGRQREFGICNRAEIVLRDSGETGKNWGLRSQTWDSSVPSVP